MTELTVRVMNPQPVPEAFMDGQARAIAAFEGVLRGIIAGEVPQEIQPPWTVPTRSRV